MFKVSISRKARDSKYGFIESYKSLFISLYSDTGIQNEDEIIDNYIKLSKKLSTSIDTILYNTLEEEIVLGTSKGLENSLFITRKCEGFVLKIQYKENTKIQERYIQNISFYKK